jgi:hypothetical protein
VDELADSSGVLHDPAILRQRLAEAGYLFFRGLLAAGTVRAAGATVLARLRDGGWARTARRPGSRARSIRSTACQILPSGRH